MGSGDLRIKVCIEPTEEDFVTIHHELGHDFYFQRYDKLPILLQTGANDGFHEAIGDTIALSVTPEYLRTVGLLRPAATADAGASDRGRINQQMKMALEKIAFLPFGLLIDKWRWDVFSGKVGPSDYNAAWWALKEKVQGVRAPVTRSADEFDPGAKFHVASSTPYIRATFSRAHLPVSASHQAPAEPRDRRFRFTTARFTTARLLARNSWGSCRSVPASHGRTRWRRSEAAARPAPRRCSSTLRPFASGSRNKTKGDNADGIEMKTLRVATLNIWNRLGPWEQRLPAIRSGIAELSPDLLGLQEVVTALSTRRTVVLIR